MSIRLQLLLVALTTLVLPWAGCQYARELESALRGSQEKSLLAAAGTIANALSAQPQRVFHDDAAERAAPFSADAGDLYVAALKNQPLLDGYRDDWGVAAPPARLASRSGYAAQLQVASTEQYLYLYVEVEDTHFDPQPNEVNLAKDRFDRIVLTCAGPDGNTTHYFFGTNAPGYLAAQNILKGEDAVERVVFEPRIQGFWLQTAKGYHLEARIPLSLLGKQIWVEAVDGSGERQAGVTAAEHPSGGRLFFPTGGLDDLLATFIREGTRATVIDANALKMGAAGSLSDAAPYDSAPLEPIWRYFIGIDTSAMTRIDNGPGHWGGQSVASALAGTARAQWVLNGANAEPLLTAAAPIQIEGDTRGVVYLEQAADQLLALRDRALSRLFNFTLLATGMAVIIMSIFATFISVRIGRLRDAADSAVSHDGRIRLAMPGAKASDEIGDLARGFERLLARLNEHTQYLRTLGGKLSHELRTPLTIVRSSLENLESDGLREDQIRFIARARDGTQRLTSILSALGAAARVEESIRQAERSNFDLREMLESTVAAYRGGFPNTRILLEAPGDACYLRGAPDLIAQMLDKLIENAVDFCPPAGAITVRLARSDVYTLSVANDGPLIPESTLTHLFESLYEQRSGRDDRPHFGLGLYIVRLVAEFHGGTALAANRPDGGGALFTVTLPLI